MPRSALFQGAGVLALALFLGACARTTLMAPATDGQVSRAPGMALERPPATVGQPAAAQAPAVYQLQATPTASLAKGVAIEDEHRGGNMLLAVDDTLVIHTDGSWQETSVRLYGNDHAPHTIGHGKLSRAALQGLLMQATSGKPSFIGLPAGHPPLPDVGGETITVHVNGKTYLKHAGWPVSPVFTAFAAAIAKATGAPR